MVAGMDAALVPGRYVYCSLPPGAPEQAVLAEALAMFREAEGLSVLLSEDAAGRFGLAASPPMRQITLHVYSSLTGTGLTAAVAGALAARGIACNMIAATLHDHVFVPAERAEEALETLQALQEAAKDG